MKLYLEKYRTMNSIVLHDKKFKICMTAAQIDEAVAKVAEKINADMKDVEVPIFLCILNGSFMFTADLMRKVDIQSDIVFVKLASYEGTSSTGNVKQILGLSKSVEGRTVVVVEDIVETGNTIEEIHRILKDAGAAQIKICTLLFKPEAYKKPIPIDYPALSIPNDFIVGYGLDYNQLGRQYKDIYVLDESGE